MEPYDSFVDEALKKDYIPPRAMSKQVEGLQLEWSSSSLTDLAKCPRRYYYRYRLNLQPKGQQIALDFGKAFHRVGELRDRMRAAGLDTDTIAEGVVRYCLECGFDSDDTKRNRFTLTRAAVWFVDKYANDYITPTEIRGKLALETYFTIDLGVETAEGESFLIRGFLDRVIDYQGELAVEDYKTTQSSLDERYFKRFSPDLQMTLYSIGAATILPKYPKGVLINAIQTAVNFTRFARQFVSRPKEYLEESLTDIAYWLKQAELFAKQDYYPKNETACFLCDYNTICPMRPESRHLFLEKNFEVRR